MQQVVLKLGGVATPLPPSIANFTPSNGSAGTSVTITGNNFIGATEVRFGGTAAGSFTVDSDTQITATVPAGATTGPITVIIPVGSGASATNFTVTVPIPAPTVDSFTPATGGVGTTVTITGGNFTGVSGVSFGGVATSSFTVVSGTEITATVPTGAVTGRIRVTNATGFGESATDFQVVAAPTFDAANPFTPRQGFQNNPVAINGQSFDVDSPTPPQVFFGTIQAPVSNFTPTLIQVSVPPGGTPQLLVPVRVVTTGGEARSDTLTPPVLFRFL